MASDCPPTLQELRVVLLGKTGAGKSQVARALLGGKGPKGESGMCILREGEAAGKTMYVVDTPGWCRIDIHRTSEKIRKEIVRSVTLCPPGPHALILVLPVTSLDEVSPVKELKTASRHIKLLSDSDRVWKHTMVLFWCDRDVEESVIDEHIKKAGKLLENCNGRYYVLRNMDSETQVHGLLEKIEHMVEDNCGDFFLPQIYQELIATKIPKDMVDQQRMYEDREERLKQAYLKRLSAYKTQQVEGTELKQRRSSIDGARPSCVNVKTGEVFPASCPHRGLAEDLRSARSFMGGQMVEVYDSSKELVKIGPCRPNRDLAFWLGEDDDTILQYLSTSPYAEPPHFVQHTKSTIQFLLDHPNPDSLFPEGQPQFFSPNRAGGVGES